jgi:hypothetical protein
MLQFFRCHFKRPEMPAHRLAQHEGKHKQGRTGKRAYARF